MAHGRRVVEREGQALLELASSLDESFAAATEVLLNTHQRVIVTGMGKSGHIGRKIAATLAATGTPSFFLHPAEAAHGDLGMIVRGDVLLVLSNSGATAELDAVLRHGQTLGCAVIGVTAQPQSPLSQRSDVLLLLPALPEACPKNMAPTTSTALMLALGDALAVAVMESRGWTRDHLRILHPGGSLGSRMAYVDEIMHTDDALPLVAAGAPMKEVVIEMTLRRFGIAGVMGHDSNLVGVITDGDLRRHCDDLFHSSAQDVMTARPITVPEGTRCEDALALMQSSRITCLFVMSANRPSKPVGLVHIHDLTSGRGS
ncbi:KpsF/GutQ family sugar-phosphate isomerase [Sphingomonas ginkgonis]|uniref:KpsF/GutQ family sugar-phosphate isomerase n=1 Tax=Sphingomonas ginkgonis TaxID=2315330 RepID=UPI001EEFB50F|nr:KpsF/GutQ family sugar-phosphate isomerase [Sphingomonas ginkgonis]